MALKRDIRTCPYCGESIALGDCRIVATNFLTSQTGTIADRRPVSGARALDVLNGYPVVAEPGVSSTLRKLAPLRELASLEDLPARACSSCRYPLPPDIEDRTLATIAVVGIQGVGKTHFLASMWRGAYNEQGLSPFGVVEFAPDDNTAPLYGAHYFKPVFVKRDRLPGTNVDPLIRFRPLTFRMTVESKRFALLFHDIAGEVLTEREQRAATLAFLRRANAVIFLIDPLWLGALRDEHLTTPINPDDAPDFAYDQASLLRGVINDINDLGSTAEVPFAITIAKSDLLSKATGRQASRFAQAPPKGGDEWLDDIAKVGDEVRELLRALDEHALVAEAERLPRASYHAVAPIGHEGGNAAPRPLRCLDPLASVILRLPQLT